MTEGRSSNLPLVVGPIVGAIILVGGYIAYSQWHEKHQHAEECATMKRSYLASTNPYEMPAMVRDLDGKCPGWVDAPYGRENILKRHS